ncbi:PTS transporter subunit EIIC [Amphibacillus sp. Q70]|uniref:PTS transporter subunit EIIC n=1 Tax=Amphibacillus sp. Q70 TaxID=3453416 RepID=UPI003F879316
MNNFEELSDKIIELVGGKSNISYLTHCVTRLRFNLKDQSLVDVEKLESLDEVMGSQLVSGQFQLIIGPQVEGLYEAIVPRISSESVVEENGDQNYDTKKGFDIKSIPSKMLTNMTACITPVVPLIICAGFLKIVPILFGPMLLGLLEEESSTLTILTLLGDLAFHYLPIFLAYTTAKHFKLNPFIGLLLGVLLVNPDLMNLLENGENLTLFGIPIYPADYIGSVLPIILIVWVASLIRKAFNKLSAKAAKNIAYDALTILIVLPIALCILGPLGTILSDYVMAFFMFVYNVFGPLGIGLIAVCYLPLILTGMHHAINLASIMALTTTGADSIVLVGATAAWISVIGVTLGFAVKAKRKQNKNLGITSAFMQAFVGITEPALFGILLPYKRVFLAHMIGSFIGGSLLGFFQVKIYAMLGSAIVIYGGYLGDEISNLIFALVGSLIGAIISFVLVMVFGFDEKKAGKTDILN